MMRFFGPRKTPDGSWAYAVQVETALGPVMVTASVSERLHQWMRKNVRVEAMGGDCGCPGPVPEILRAVAVELDCVAEESARDLTDAWVLARRAAIGAGIDAADAMLPPWLMIAAAGDTPGMLVPPCVTFRVDDWVQEPAELVPDVLCCAIDALTGEAYTYARPGTSDLLAGVALAGS